MVPIVFSSSLHYAWRSVRQRINDLFAVAWQGQTYRRLGYLLLAVPLGLAYSLILMIGLLFPIILVYLAILRSGPLSPLFFATIVIGFFTWRLIPRIVKTAIELEKILARELVGLFTMTLEEPRLERSGNRQSLFLQSDIKGSLKKLFFLSSRIPMGYANLILIIISISIPILMLLAPWIYELNGPGVIFGSASIDTSPKAIFLMLLAVPMLIVFLRGLRTLALIQGKFAVFMLADNKNRGIAN